MTSTTILDFLKRYLILTGAVFLLCSSASTAQWDSVLWVPQNVPVVQSPSHVWLDVFFLPEDPQRGWACGFGGNITRTTDGGETWQTVVIPANQLESIHFVNESVGYVSGPDASAGTIWKSVDGGVTWRDITPTVPIQVGLNLWGCYFVDENNGVVIGGGCGTNQLFFRTTDGGNSWQLRQYAETETGLSDAIIYDANGEGYAVSSGYLWVTQDGGQSWDIFNRTVPRDMITNDWQEEITHKGESFLLPVSPGCNGQTGEGVLGFLRFTDDFGRTWRQFPTAGPMFGSFLLDEQRGWGVGQNKQVFYTLDAGQNWTQSACGILDGEIMDDIWFVDDTTAWMAGTDIYKMTIYQDVPLVIDTIGSLNLCAGSDTLVLIASEGYAYYEWSNGETSRQLTIVSQDQVQNGQVSVTAYQDLDRCYAKTVNIDVNIYDSNFEIAAPDGTVFCDGESIKLSVPEYYGTFRWSNGATTSTIEVAESGVYVVTVGTVESCYGVDSIEIVRNPRPDPVVVPGGPLLICEGGSLVLRTANEWSSYRWQDGSTSRELFVDTPGEYRVEVTNEHGCVGTSAIVSVEYDAIATFLQFSPDPTTGVQFSSIVGELLCADVIVTNTSSTATVDISNMNTAENVFFSIPPSMRRGTLLPGESIAVEVCFEAASIGEFDDQVYVYLDTLCAPVIPLFGDVSSELLQGQSRCNIVLRGIVEGQAERIAISPPYPQPASREIQFDFTLSNHEENNVTLSYELRNFFGTLVASGRRSVSATHITRSRGDKVTGSVNIALRELPPGSYILTVGHKSANVGVPVLIVR